MPPPPPPPLGFAATPPIPKAPLVAPSEANPPTAWLPPPPPERADVPLNPAFPPLPTESHPPPLFYAII